MSGIGCRGRCCRCCHHRWCRCCRRRGRRCGCGASGFVDDTTEPGVESAEPLLVHVGDQKDFVDPRNLRVCVIPCSGGRIFALLSCVEVELDPEVATVFGFRGALKIQIWRPARVALSARKGSRSQTPPCPWLEDPSNSRDPPRRTTLCTRSERG